MNELAKKKKKDIFTRLNIKMCTWVKISLYKVYKYNKRQEAD